MSKDEMDALGKSIDSHLDNLGIFEMKIMPILSLGLWLGLWLGAHFRWWTALLIALGLLIGVLMLTVRYTKKYLRSRAQDFSNRWKRGSPEQLQAFKQLAEAYDFQLKEEFLQQASLLQQKEFDGGAEIIKQLASSIKDGMNVKDALLKCAETIKEADEFLGQEFLDSCSELLKKPNTDPVHIVSRAGLDFQLKLLLESSNPKDPNPNFSSAVQLLIPYYDFLARDAMRKS